ncbi:MAG: UXX-star (seleno)protein family 3 [Candidatus Binatia bacterium]
MAVTLYTRDGCGYCAAIEKELLAAGKAFRVINVDKNPERIPELLKISAGRRVVPVLVDGSRIAVAPRGGTNF